MNILQAYKENRRNGKKVRVNNAESYVDWSGEWGYFKDHCGELTFLIPKKNNRVTVIYDIPLEVVISDGWEVEEKWYEDIPNKYPNGVDCWVRKPNSSEFYKMCIKKYSYAFGKFQGDNGIFYEDVIPVKSKDAPSIIGDDL